MFVGTFSGCSVALGPCLLCGEAGLPSSVSSAPFSVPGKEGCGRRGPPCSGPWRHSSVCHPAPCPRAQGSSSTSCRCETWQPRPRRLPYTNADGDRTCLPGPARMQGLLPPWYNTWQMLALLSPSQRDRAGGPATHKPP